jgi:GNAT superfamily N-acetyltransferase
MTGANQFVSVMMPLVDPFGGRAALNHESAHVVGDFMGAALWVPPGAHTDEEAMGKIFEKHIEQPRLGEVYALFEKMAEYHPAEPHWYLPLIGVDPVFQRRGLGSALMQHGVAACDRGRTLAYLEATGPASVPLYRRHGFEVIGEIVVGNSPPLFPMLRRPR